MLTDPDAEGRRLLAFARRSRVDGVGFGWLGESGALDRTQGVHTWITARMTYVFALAALRGEPDALDLAGHGVAGLTSGPLRDREHAGWLGSVDADGSPRAVAKLAYDHAFVVLAASTAVAAGVPGADGLLVPVTRAALVRALTSTLAPPTTTTSGDVSTPAG